jgi:hypothetical protein
MGPKAAISAIEKKGILLVYPISGRTDPESLWSVSYPREKMRWEWDEDGDDRVARLWHLREELSRSRKVVYAKWFQGRATFFSRDAFRTIRALYLRCSTPLGKDARLILSLLEESSPRSTKELKRESGLQGRLLESTYQKALKELWTRLLIVGFGEVNEGAFPSLAVGASGLLFEDLSLEARELTADRAQKEAAALTSRSPALVRFLERTLSACASR